MNSHLNNHLYFCDAEWNMLFKSIPKLLFLKAFSHLLGTVQVNNGYFVNYCPQIILFNGNKISLHI